METNRIRSIAIVGGGTAGWMAASVLARKLRGLCQIHLVESPDIPTVGVGEATVPPILDLLQLLRIDRADFFAKTQATIKLAIRFLDWAHLGHVYWHPFGGFGASIDGLPFIYFWHKARRLNAAPDKRDLNLEIALAFQEPVAMRRDRFDGKSSTQDGQRSRHVLFSLGHRGQGQR